ncbi:MAG: Ig-like domain-containing protein [Ignavibacteriales bacterium]|nr:Ig-like domain-containing protein [Ignavibacteriales bacterium]
MKHIRILPICLLVCFAVTLPAQQQKLEVVANSPKGTTQSLDQSQTVFVCFNQPMVPLMEAPQDEDVGPMLLVPKVRGKYRWMGTKMLAFTPADTLPPATAFKVSVPRGTKSLSGQSLDQDYSWTFETPRPTVVQFNPDTADLNAQFFRYGLTKYERVILLKFNMRIDPGSLADFIQLSEISKGSAIAVPFSLRHPTEKELSSSWHWTPFDHSIVVIPTQPLKPLRQYMVCCKAGLRTMQGPLGMESNFEFSFTTPRKLAITSIGKGKGGWGGGEVAVRFSNPLGSNWNIGQDKTFLFNPPIASSKLSFGTGSDSTFLIYGPFEPDREYTLTIGRGIKDIFGDTLAETSHFAFKTSPTPTSVSLGGPHLVRADSVFTYPLTFVNADQVRIDVYQIDPDIIIPILRNLEIFSTSYSPWPEFLFFDRGNVSPQQWNRIYSKEWSIRSERNKPVMQMLVLNELSNVNKRGIFLIQADLFKQVGGDRRYRHNLVQFTNLGITAKFSTDTNLVWVTRLNDGSPVSDASVEIRGDSNVVAWRGRTDHRGIVLTPGWRRLGLRTKYSWEEIPPQWVIVKYGDDAAFASSDWTFDIQPKDFRLQAVDTRRESHFRAVIFTDRNLYRPGEQVQIKGIVRQLVNDRLIVPQDVKLRFVVSNNRSKSLLQVEPTVTAFGSFSVNLPLDKDASLGKHWMTLTRMKRADEPRGYYDEPWETITSEQFEVEMFKSSDIEVKPTIDSKQYIMGDSLRASISAHYLFGAPYRNEPLSWKIFLKPESWRPQGFGEYFFGLLPWKSSRQQRWRQPDFERKDTLDALGCRQVGYKIPTGVFDGTQSLRLEGEVFMKDYRSVAGSATTIVHNGEFSLGIAPGTTFASEGKDISCRFVAVRPDQQVQSGVSFTAKVIRETWRREQEKDTTGKTNIRWKLHDSVETVVGLRTSDKPLRWQFKPAQAGFYLLEAEGKDARGNNVRSQAYCYVSGVGTSPWSRSDSNRVDLIVDKQKYEPGETAQILIPSPYQEFQALVTIERNGILSQFTKAFKGNFPQLSLPMLAEYAPNVFVSVVLIPSRAEGVPAKADKSLQGFVMGYANLIVTPKDKQLSVDVRPKNQNYHPGDTVDIDLSVKNAAGNGTRCEITLSVPDRAILNMTDYRFPSLLDAFYVQRPLGVETADSRLQYVERPYRRRPESVAMYCMVVDGEGDGRAEPRKEFRPLAYWNPAILTDARGKATVRFKLADDLTAFQIMASAQTTQSEFGYGESSFTVSKPLLLKPSLPRFVRVGDVFEGGVVVHNSSPDERNTRLAVSVHGLIIKGDSIAVCTVKPGESRKIHFTFCAAKLGEATFAFAATEETRQLDALRWTIPIEPSTQRQTIATYESTADEKTTERIIVPANADPDAGDIEALVSCSGLVGLNDALAYLLRYPYGCLEQRLSALLPLITASDLVRTFEPVGLRVSNVDSIVITSLGKFRDYQLPTGGYSYWTSGSAANQYLSALAVYALVQAKRAHYEVDTSQLNLGLRYVRLLLEGKEKSRYYTEGALWCTRALILYTLALEGQSDEREMASMFAMRPRLPMFAKTYLLKSFLTSKNHATEAAQLADELSNLAKVSSVTAHFEEPDETGFEWIFHSTARTTALVLQALIEVQPKNPLIPRIVRWLLEQRQYGRWRTTQENLYTIDALATYFRTFESGEPDLRAVVRLDSVIMVDKQLVRQKLSVASGSYPLSQLKVGRDYPIQFEKNGRGTLYYGLRMNFYPKGNTVGADEGLAVLKTISVVDTLLARSSSYPLGSILKVQLTVIANKTRTFIVIDDPLPAGFEAINERFKTTASWDRDIDDEKSEFQRWWRQFPFSNVELRDDRVVLFADDLPAGSHTFTYFVRTTSRGTFSLPSTRAEGMYEPEIFGRTSSQLITIQ